MKSQSCFARRRYKVRYVEELRVTRVLFSNLAGAESLRCGQVKGARLDMSEGE